MNNASIGYSCNERGLIVDESRNLVVVEGGGGFGGEEHQFNGSRHLVVVETIFEVEIWFGGDSRGLTR